MRVQGNARTPLQFVTNGVLVKMLTAPPAELDSVTHIVLDEIHERDRFADFAIILLLRVLKERPALRLVLMSATLQTELFSAFFGNCPVLNVPGRTYPVQEYFLEDVLRLTESAGPVRDCLQTVRACS